MNSLFKSILYKKTGTRHLSRNKPCEDSVASLFNEDQTVYAIALSDGAGSYAKAKTGADTAVQCCTNVLTQSFDWLYNANNEQAAQFILNKIRESLHAIAQEEQHPLIDYSSTLLCAAAHTDGRYLLFHVGDGSIVALNKKMKMEVISVYQHNGPVNQTTFITVPDTDYFIQKGSGDYLAYFLMSDGPEEFLINGNQVHPKISLLQQLAFFYTTKDMADELSILVQDLQKAHMFDDCSFAVLLNRQAIGDVFSSLEPGMQRSLFEYSFTTKEKKQTSQILSLLAQSPHGASSAAVSRRLFLHSGKYVPKKMVPLIQVDLVRYRNGKYYLND